MAAMRMVADKAKTPFVIDLVCPDGQLADGGLPCQTYGAVDDAELAKLYQQADVFVCASEFESFGYPVLEAMACGSLVVSTDCGGVRDFVIHRETGWLVPPNDPGALAAGILHVLDEMPEAERQAMRQRALAKARTFTWARYADELHTQILQFLAQRPTTVVPAVIDSVPLKNFTYAKRMAQYEQWPQLVDLPLSVPFTQIIAQGAERAVADAELQLQSPAVIEQQIHAALAQKKGFSLVSLGDTECGFLGINRQAIVPYLDIPAKGYVNAGYRPEREAEERRQLLSAIERASVIGIPAWRHGLTQRPLLDALTAQGLQLDNKQWCDSTVAYKLSATGGLARVLRSSSLRVVCIGNESQRMMPFLRRQGINVIAAFSPVRGVQDAPRIVERAARFTFDLALVAAGAASVPICVDLAQTHQVVALDIGKCADEWVTGIRLLDGPIDCEALLSNARMTAYQKALALDVQSGYQEGLNQLMPSQQSLPVGTLPSRWIKRHVIGGAGLTQTEPVAAAARVNHPLWLAARLQQAAAGGQPLSVWMIDERRWQKLNAPYYRDQLLPLLRQIDVLGLPYLEHQACAMRIAASPEAHFPRAGWVDATALEQLQYDHLGRFLPTWLRGKRLLVVSRTVQKDVAFLERNGYSVWGAIADGGEPNAVLEQIRACRQFDVALFAGGVETLRYTQVVAAELGKIALDIGDAIRDANRCFYGVQWLRGRIHKTE